MLLFDSKYTWTGGEASRQALEGATSKCGCSRLLDEKQRGRLPRCWESMNTYFKVVSSLSMAAGQPLHLQMCKCSNCQVVLQECRKKPEFCVNREFRIIYGLGLW
ncbi:unnamed protein product [Discosporangium mesarthrocarpum]